MGKRLKTSQTVKGMPSLNTKQNEQKKKKKEKEKTFYRQISRKIITFDWPFISGITHTNAEIRGF